MKYHIESFLYDYAIYDNKGNVVHVFKSRIYAEQCCELMNKDYNL